MLAGRGVGQFSGSVRRPIIDDQDTHTINREEAAHERPDVVALVVRWDDHHRAHGTIYCLSNRRDEICSETRPTRNTTTAKRISNTAPLGMRAWTATFQMPYAIPRSSETMLIGTKIRSGLKIVITRSRIKKNFAPSRASFTFEWPTRGRASMGSNLTL